MAVSEKAAQHPLWEEAAAWQAISRTPDGQFALQALVKRFGFTTQSLWSSDPLMMARNEGSRMVCVHIGRMIGMDPNQTADTTADRSE